MRIAADGWYDLWLPQLVPRAKLVRQAQGAMSAKGCAAFALKHREEIAEPYNARLVALLAAFSHRTDLAVGCYCEDQARCEGDCESGGRDCPAARPAKSRNRVRQLIAVEPPYVPSWPSLSRSPANLLNPDS